MNQLNRVSRRFTSLTDMTRASTFLDRVRSRYPEVPAETFEKKERICRTVLQANIRKIDPYSAMLDRYNTHLNDYKALISAPPGVSEGRGGKIFRFCVDEAERSKSRWLMTAAFKETTTIKQGLTEINDKATERERFCYDWALNRNDYDSLVQYMVDHPATAYHHGIPEVRDENIDQDQTNSSNENNSDSKSDKDSKKND